MQKDKSLNQYAISKLIIDYYVLDNLDRFESIQGFRYFNVYGTGEDHKGDQMKSSLKVYKQLKRQANLNCLKDPINFTDFVCG